MKYKVLILEDNEMDASLMEEHLQRAEYNYEIKWVRTGETYEKAIAEFEPDVIICDYRLKQYSGLDAIYHKNIVCEEIPLIIVSGTIGEEKAVELIKKGATDFLIKNNINSRLSQTVIRAIKESIEREKRQKAELELKSSEKRFRLLFEHSVDGIIIGNPNKQGGVITANDATCKMTGYTSSELQGRALEEFINIDKKDQNGLFRGEVNLKQKDGSLLPVDVSSRTIELKSGEQRSFYIIRDISERKEYELQLEKKNMFTEKAINSLPGIFYMIDEKKDFIRINNNVESELGYSREEFQQMNPLDLYFEEDQERISKEIEKAFVEGQTSTVARMKKKNGSSDSYLITGSHFEQEDKNYVLGTAINISDRIKAQQKVEESLKEKETLLTEIHHRVKNNLAVVSGMMQLQAFNEEEKKCTNKLLNSVSRIKSIALIHEHLYQSKSLSHVELSTNLQELLQKIQETFSYETDIDHTFDLQKITLNINQAIPFALIINEIITNIYKHAFAKRSKGKIKVILKESDNYITLLIKDNGIGLPKDFNIEQAETIGLTLIDTLCQQLRGDIKFSSNKETVFQLKFERSENIGSSNSLK